MGRLKFFLILALVAFVLVAVGGLVVGQTPEATAKGKADQSIQGTVMDADGLPIPGVTVEIKGTLIRTETDDQGAFVFSGLPAGTWTLVASLPSFRTSETNVSLNAGQHLKLDIKLDVAPLDYEVTVRSDVPKLMEASDSIGVVSLSPVQIATLPSLGEKDIFRSIQLMPGVSASNEASAGLYVRGGTPDQNLVLFDGSSGRLDSGRTGYKIVREAFIVAGLSRAARFGKSEIICRGGTELPIKITGTRQAPKFGLNW